MASYAELFNLRQDSELLNRVAVACVIAAEKIRTEDVSTANHAARLVWARSAFTSPQTQAIRMWMAVLAANKDATVEAIRAVTDTVLQTKVDAAVDVFLEG
jgi:hypothetical protein